MKLLCYNVKYITQCVYASLQYSNNHQLTGAITIHIVKTDKDFQRLRGNSKKIH